MIVVDTGAMVALLDGNEVFHPVLRALYEENEDKWKLPSAILPEVDSLVSKYLGGKAQDAFLADLAEAAISNRLGQRCRPRSWPSHLPPAQVTAHRFCGFDGHRDGGAA